MTESLRFPPLARDAVLNPSSIGSGRRRIAIFSPNVMGPLKNGGVGTVSVVLAEALASWGHDVTLILGSHEDLRVPEFELWQQRFAGQGIRLIHLPKAPFPIGAPRPARTSYAVWLYLKKNEFDIVHFCDLYGLGYYALTAKKLGLGFARTIFCVWSHGSTAWHYEGNHSFVGRGWELAVDYLERKSIELADVVIGASQYALNWCVQRGWKLPKRSFVEQYMLSSVLEDLPPPVPRRPKEVVFFGRIETRKGIDIFCDALERLSARDLQGITVTFLGSLGRVEGKPAHHFLRSRSAHWKFPWKLISGYDQHQALRYLRSRPVLVVLPSRAETLGYTAVECIASGIPFLASRIPAYEELLSRKDHSGTLFDDADSLARMIRKRLLSGTRARPRFAKDPEKTRAAHRLWHERVRIPSPSPPRRSAEPLVSVCIAHRNRSSLLKECLASLAAQTYRRFEIIVADDGSEPGELRRLRSLIRAQRGLRIRAVELPRARGPGAARNAAAARARGEYLLFMDDDDLALPEELRTFVSAARAGRADVLTCACARFPGKGIWVPLGDSLAHGAIRNTFGNANAFWKRKSFSALGGFRETLSLQEDAEILARAVVSGLVLEVVPEPLYRYRAHPGSRSRAASDEGMGDFLRVSAYRPLLQHPDLQSLFFAAPGFERRTSENPFSRQRTRPVIPLFDTIQEGLAYPRVRTLFRASRESGPFGRLRVKSASEGITFTLAGLPFHGARTLHAVLEATAPEDFLVELRVEASLGDRKRFDWVSSCSRLKWDRGNPDLPLDPSRFRAGKPKRLKRADLFLDASRFRGPVELRIYGGSGTLLVRDFKILDRN